MDGTPAGTWVESRGLTYVKIFNSSHMVPYDVPLVSHDMILRFMGVNFSAIADGSAGIPSKVGDDTKPRPIVLDGEDDSDAKGPSGKTPEQDKAMWEGKFHVLNDPRPGCNLISSSKAYYNAGSAALVLVLIALAIGSFLYCRRRRKTGRLTIGNPEEVIPLSQSENGRFMNGDRENGNYKGKGRALESEAIFDVGEGSDDESDYRDRDEGRRK